MKSTKSKNKIFRRNDDGELVLRKNPPQPLVEYRNALKKCGIKQWVIAHHLNISQAALSNHLLGFQPLTEETRQRLDVLMAEIIETNSQEED